MNQVWETHDYFPGDTYTKRIPNTATRDYHCHDFAWRKGNRRKKKVDATLDKLPIAPGNHIDVNKIMANPEQWGFTYIGKNYRVMKPADVVVYLQSDGSTAHHSGLVLRLNPKGVRSGDDVYMMSKDGPNSLFRHRFGTSAKTNYFQHNFAAGGVRVYRRK
ncbi:MAG: hypothetical protein GY765_34865, partial [bacterium]|nr:hypothetical protein [bacterium]